MRDEDIKILAKAGILRPKSRDDAMIRSLVSSAKIDANIAKGIKLSDKSATVIFREIYESIRELGDAKWWLLGYEPGNHEISMDILKDINIKEKIMLNHLERFKKIRHDANYRGFRVLEPQAKEMIEFWDKCGEEIASKIEKETG